MISTEFSPVLSYHLPMASSTTRVLIITYLDPVKYEEEGPAALDIDRWYYIILVIVT